jgi:hypothetical protein
MGRLSALPVALLSLLAVSCGEEAAPLPHRVFVPVVAGSRPHEARPWRSLVEVTTSGPGSSRLRASRWPPDSRENEVEEWTVHGGRTVRVPFRGPVFPAVSSLLLEGDADLAVHAELTGFAGDPARVGAFRVEVPVLDASALARPGDTLVVGHFASGPGLRTALGFTCPWTERDAVPYTVDVVFGTPDGRTLREVRQTLPGLPFLLDDPWYHYSLPPGVPFDVRVTLAGSARGRRTQLGIWVYGLSVDLETGAARFLETRLFRTARR